MRLSHNRLHSRRLLNIRLADLYHESVRWHSVWSHPCEAGIACEGKFNNKISSRSSEPSGTFTLWNSTSAPSAIPSNSRMYWGNELWTHFNVSLNTIPCNIKEMMSSFGFTSNPYGSSKFVHSLPFSELYSGRYTLFNGSDNFKKLLIIDANVRPCKLK